MLWFSSRLVSTSTGELKQELKVTLNFFIKHLLHPSRGINFRVNNLCFFNENGSVKSELAFKKLLLHNQKHEPIRFCDANEGDIRGKGGALL